MAEQSSARKRKPAAKAGSSGSGADPEFDGWLDVRLKSIFDSVLQEPLPEEMMNLLKRPKSPP